VAAAYKCTVDTEFETTAKLVYNDEHLTDFAAFLDVAPVTYMNIGSRNEEKGFAAPHHHGEFDIDEDCLPISMAMYVQFVYDYFGIEK